MIGVSPNIRYGIVDRSCSSFNHLESDGDRMGYRTCWIEDQQAKCMRSGEWAVEIMLRLVLHQIFHVGDQLDLDWSGVKSARQFGMWRIAGKLGVVGYWDKEYLYNTVFNIPTESHVNALKRGEKGKPPIVLDNHGDKS
jgi:hypothetical protein